MISKKLGSILAVLCLCIAPPLAWQAKRPKTSDSHVIPSSPGKQFRRYSWTLEEIARKADHYKKIRRGFDALKSSTKKIRKSVVDAKNNPALNRNSTLLCFDETRSCKDLDGFYINANDVYTPVQNYMVTQGPLETTVGDFWKAVLHNNSDLIVTLVMHIENGKNKCASYWTIPQFQVDGWTITLDGEELLATSFYIPTHRIVERRFTAKNGQTLRTIRQIHYENRPDGKTPELELFTKLLDIVDEKSTTCPITVHCSAGVGRSGTFVAAHSLRKELRSVHGNTTKINIPKAVYNLRCQRLGLVGSAGQYKMIFKTLAKEYRPRAHPFFVNASP